MSAFIQGLAWPLTPKKVELAIDQIATATRSIPMPDILDEVEKALSSHDTTISALEGFMAKHAEKAALATDPTRLGAVLDKIKAHTARLSDLMVKFPLIQP